MNKPRRIPESSHLFQFFSTKGSCLYAFLSVKKFLCP
uniref:Uncharacterized protein n=1 Tax=Anguilla anguilla TaxID=7936 RepID=A0A0E9R1L2_ANGAN